jgi:hypothetical protein
MNNIIKILLITLTLVLTLGIASASDAPKGMAGMYSKNYELRGGKTLTYQVDTVSRICYAIITDKTGTSITVIPCEKLARRPEWKALLHWSKKEAQNKP